MVLSISMPFSMVLVWEVEDFFKSLTLVTPLFLYINPC